MISYKHISTGLFVASLLVLGVGFCGENEAESNTSESSNDSSSSNNDSGPSVAETTAQIANDPGAGFGGDR